MIQIYLKNNLISLNGRADLVLRTDAGETHSDLVNLDLVYKCTNLPLVTIKRDCKCINIFNKLRFSYKSFSDETLFLLMVKKNSKKCNIGFYNVPVLSIIYNIKFRLK